MLILHEHMQCHVDLIGVEDIGLYRALVVRDRVTAQVKYINISKENSIEEIVFDNEDEKKQFLNYFAEQRIDLASCE